MMAAQRIDNHAVTLGALVGKLAGDYAQIVVSGVALDSRLVKTGNVFCCSIINAFEIRLSPVEIKKCRFFFGRHKNLRMLHQIIIK